MTLLSLTLLFPLVLMALMVLMERVERPLRRMAFGEQLESFFADARPDDVEAFVSQGTSEALDRYWKRRRLSGLLSSRAR